MNSRNIADRIPEKDDFNTFSQKESQKVIYILKVLTALDWHKELNTSDIITKTGLSPKSVVGTLRILRDKGLVDFKTKKKWNNEKIYSIRRTKSLFYMVKLIQWKFNKSSQGMQRDLEKFENKINDNFPKELEDIPITLTDKWRKLIPKSILPKDNLPLKEWNSAASNTIKILYNSGFYCDECFKKGRLVELILDDEHFVCKKCGKESEYREEVHFMGSDIKSRFESFKDNKYILKRKSKS